MLRKPLSHVPPSPVPQARVDAQVRQNWFWDCVLTWISS